MSRVRIIAVSRGLTPTWVREAQGLMPDWFLEALIGLEMQTERWDDEKSNVLGLGNEAQNRDGYTINHKEFIRTLSAQRPKAAGWWKESMWNGCSIIFERENCQLLP